MVRPKFAQQFLRLRDENAAAKAQMIEMKAELTRVADLAGQNGQLNREVDTLRADNVVLEAERNSLSETVLASLALRESQQHTIDLLTAQLSDVDTENGILRSKIASLEVQFGSLHTVVNTLVVDNQTTKAENRMMKAETDTLCRTSTDIAKSIGNLLDRLLTVEMTQAFQVAGFDQVTLAAHQEAPQFGPCGTPKATK